MPDQPINQMPSVTRCPTAAVARTTGTISEADARELQKYAAEKDRKRAIRAARFWGKKV
jgi:hypothetical protein